MTRLGGGGAFHPALSPCRADVYASGVPPTEVGRAQGLGASARSASRILEKGRFTDARHPRSRRGEANAQNKKAALGAWGGPHRGPPEVRHEDRRSGGLSRRS